MNLYDEHTREKLYNIIVDFMKAKKLLLNVYTREYEQINLNKKVKSYSVDRPEDIEEIRGNFFKSVYESLLCKPKIANLKVENNGVGNFEVEGKGVFDNFTVHQGKIFKINFITTGYNGLIEFLKKNINLNKKNYLEERLFEKGKYKITFSKSYNDSKEIEVLDIQFYLQKSLGNKVTDFIRKKKSMRHGGDKNTKKVREKNISLNTTERTKITEIEKFTPLNELEKNIFDVKSLDRKKLLRKILDYISNEMRPEKRAKMFLLWMDYKEEKKYYKSIPNSTNEIAELVGEHPTTVRTNISKALQEIRDNFPEAIDILK